MHHSDRDAYEALVIEAGRRFQTLGREAAYLARKRKRERAARIDHFLRTTTYKLVGTGSLALLILVIQKALP